MLPTSIDIDEPARWYGTSRRTFDRNFRRLLGLSPQDYRTAFRTTPPPLGEALAGTS